MEIWTIVIFIRKRRNAICIPKLLRTLNICLLWLNCLSNVTTFAHSNQVSKENFAIATFFKSKNSFNLYKLHFSFSSDNYLRTYLDRRVVGSFMTMTSVISPYLVKYSLRLSETMIFFSIKTFSNKCKISNKIYGLFMSKKWKTFVVSQSKLKKKTISPKISK